MNRFLSRRDKESPLHKRQKSRDKSSEKKTRPLSSDGIINLFKSDPQKKIDKGQISKTQQIKQRLEDGGYAAIEDTQIEYALQSKHANGDVDKALELVILFQQSVDGAIKPYDPSIRMQGAENREGVTCYLDALLFAMFARLGSFEPILYTVFEDEPRRRLSTLIRLWVNMLRTGKLIQTDMTKHLQDALAACGWEDAALLEQQDTSEAFSFITEKLQLPLLTLKMDIYHTGADDDKDDHKFIQERLLDVAVPEASEGTDRPIKLEDCLENYFNNRVEVVRRLGRSNTISSVRSVKSASSPSAEYGSSQHVELSDVSWSSPSTPTLIKPEPTPTSPTVIDHIDGLIRHHLVKEEEEETSKDSDVLSTRKSISKGSMRKEVLMPAWQFFNLIPWYTKSSPTNDEEVAKHFSQTRPVLGICLKRYAMTADGTATRKDTFIDIPRDIRLPHFIQDELAPEDGPLMGNFKLSLQAVIFHRGDSLQSGHYISVIRGTPQAADGDESSSRRLSTASRPPNYPEDQWIRFDDCANPRVSYVDIEQTLKDEMPYLLFYQVQPTFEDSSPPSELLPPSYTDSGVSFNMSKVDSVTNGNSDMLNGSHFDGTRDESTPTIRFSAEIESPRRSLIATEDISDERRRSLAFTETSAASSVSIPDAPSIPATPNLAEETTTQRMSRAAARFKNGSKSRPTSASGENRISATFSRLNLMRSKETLSKAEANKPSIIPTDGSAESNEAIAIEDFALKADDTTLQRGRSKKGRKRGKSREPLEAVYLGESDQEKNYYEHKGKGKEREKGVPDRECIIM
ncbi:hypothetical protein B7494_g1864 [Chlorociboria aeruginascens]|nr:hypothetical protein B7494_g1864 [Chlorociboria aeruginascens]